MSIEVLTLGKLDSMDFLRAVRIYVDSWLPILRKEYEGDDDFIFNESLLQIRTWSRVFPEGQLVAYSTEFGVGGYVACVRTQTETVDDLPATHKEMLGGGYMENHKPEGNTHTCPTITVDPNLRGNGIASELLRAQCRFAFDLGMEFLYAYSRPAGYAAFLERVRKGARENLTFESESDFESFFATHSGIGEYLQERSNGTMIDPVLGRMHEKNGARLARIIPNGRLADYASKGYIVVMEYPKEVWELNSNRRTSER